MSSIDLGAVEGRVKERRVERCGGSRPMLARSFRRHDEQEDRDGIEGLTAISDVWQCVERRWSWGQLIEVE